MDDALGVGSGESGRDLLRVVDHAADRQGAAPEDRPQLPAFEQLGHDERRTLMGADVVDGQDIGVIQRRGRARFLLESLKARLVRGHFTRQDFDRDIPPEPAVVGAVDLTHAARAYFGADLILADAGVWAERVGHESRRVQRRGAGELYVGCGRADSNPNRG